MVSLRMADDTSRDNVGFKCFAKAGVNKLQRCSRFRLPRLPAFGKPTFFSYQTSDKAAQKLNFDATCITRLGIALTTCPNDGLLMLALTDVGAKNCAWLNVLNVSMRTSSTPDSLR